MSITMNDLASDKVQVYVRKWDGRRLVTSDTTTIFPSHSGFEAASDSAWRKHDDLMHSSVHARQWSYMTREVGWYVGR